MTTPRPRPTGPTQPQFFDPRRMILWSVILFVLVAAMGYAAYKAGPSAFGGFDVALKISADPIVIPLTGDDAGIITMTATATNRTSSIQTLNAPATCKVFRWILAAADGAMVQAAADECEDLLMEAKLEPGKSLTETYKVKVDPTRLKAGERYQFVIEYWGLRGMLVVHAGE